MLARLDFGECWFVVALSNVEAQRYQEQLERCIVAEGVEPVS